MLLSTLVKTKNHYASLELHTTLDIRRICFNVRRKSPICVNTDGIGTVTYEESSANFSGAMNLNTGVFIAPADGAYLISFNTNWEPDPRCQGMGPLLRNQNVMYLLLNGEIEAEARCGGDVMFAKLLNLRAGDSVYVRLQIIRIKFYGRHDSWTTKHFSGFFVSA